MLSFALTFFSLLPFYLIGCIPTGFLIARARGIDIANRGSGNVGATNVLRTVGKKAAILTLVGDIAKGALATLLGSIVSPLPYYVGFCAAAVVAGHCYSIPGKLKGGKGVATGLGALLVFDPLAAAVALAVFASILAISKTVSIASIAAALSTPLSACLDHGTNYRLLALAVIAAIISARHSQNIQRIIAGKEPRLWQPKRAQS